MKKMLWKDIFQSIAKSKGRFVSIMGLMLLGSFALVGLKVTGPNMRLTGTEYFDDLNVADLTIISELGLDENDQAVLQQVEKTAALEYGYLKDVVVKDTIDSVRIFSAGEDISAYELKKGRLPKTNQEIALDNSFAEDYAIGDTIAFTEKADAAGNLVLKEQTFEIVGFLNSGEIISSLNRGASTAGTGALKGYAVVSKNVFDSEVYMLARMTFTDMADVDPYSKTYTNRLQDHKEALADALKDRPAQRLATLKSEYQTEIDAKKTQIAEASAQLKETEQALATAHAALTASQAELATNQQNLTAQMEAAQPIVQAGGAQAAALQATFEEAQQQLATAQATLAEKEAEYEEKNQTFQANKQTAAQEIQTNEQKVTDAQEVLDNLAAPVYPLNSRREMPGGEGYKVYGTISWIVDALANVFPIFLYFVAALVTFNTMARFVDEERLNTGTLKALGYDDKDVMKKFTVYGLISSLTGATLGIILGHTLLPLIVYNAYQMGFTVPKIALRFYWQITVVALLLAIVSAVLPAWLAASKELREKPAQLLLPKPPSAGEKILLERIKPLWRRLSFTQKVTARNIFRYKKRMLMTIIGVAGAVSLLFAGFSVQHSISGINARQFGDLIHYDLIVAENDFVNKEQANELTALLDSDAVAQHQAIYYEELTKIAGDNKDTQEIKLIVPQDDASLSEYIHLENRQRKKTLALPKDGVIISERLAQLLDVQTGDTMTVKDSQNQERQMTVRGITEMYMGHFIFTSSQGYATIFGQPLTENAYLVNLTDSSTKNTEQQAANFMHLTGVKGVVQNTVLTNQINTIVHSLDQIMKILIIVAALLGIVILYNLTNINVSERIRELSTIKVLGFYDKEVTMYIYRETILLTLLGILAGFGIGAALHQYIITVVPPDDVMFNPALSAISFWVPTSIIALVTLVLGFVVNRRLKNVDMLEALKSVD